MLFSSLVPTRWRRTYDVASPEKPGYYNQQITPYLQTISHQACTHPIHVLSAVAVLGSVFYVNLLATGFFQPSPILLSNRVDLATLSAGSKNLQVGPDTAWKWQMADQQVAKGSTYTSRDVALVTLAFPDTKGLPNAALVADKLVLPDGSSAQLLPSSGNLLASISTDSSLAFSMPANESANFLDGLKEIAVDGRTVPAYEESDDEPQQMVWRMKHGYSGVQSNTVVEWAANSWTAFVELVRNAETLDIIIMTLGYLAMYLTFGSLFFSMRRMGSNVWLGAAVLLSSSFALLFGLIVTMQLGVSENLVLLSEGIPFLVVTIGFEKPIVLTQAVLSASLQAKRHNNGNGSGDAPLTLQYAVQQAVRERGFEIVRDYLVEIAILCLGAASGIQGGLKQFCFLAAWTLFFDGILLFTFYTSILTIKLEINRIKRHVALRKALEEDGISRRVAENVASSNDWPSNENCSPSEGFSIFGRKVRDGSVPRFKVLMVSGFIGINVLNLCSLPFRGSGMNSPLASAGLSSVVALPPMDPFKVAGNGLEFLLTQAKAGNEPLSVTVFHPIKYELAASASMIPGNEALDWALFDSDNSNGVFSAVGGRVVDSLLRSFEDPVLSKWVIIVLALSLALNGYLFNAARWSIKEAETTQEVVPIIMEPKKGGHAVAPNAPLPVDEDKEDELEAVDNESSKRTREQCEELVKAKKANLLTDAELVDLTLRNKIPGYALEKTLGDKTRAVKIRRSLVARTPATTDLTGKLERSLLPYKNYDYDRVHGACCENVVGYIPLPLGVAGPMVIDGRSYYIPMATTEGVLVASTSRGAKAINAGGGAVTVLTGDGMTRGPCVGFETLARAAVAKNWIDSAEGQKVMRDAFNSTSRFARLQSLKCSLAGTYLYIRFKTTTGDAMGMNMISKGVDHALKVMTSEAGFEDMAIIAVSGNYCTDKKPAAINWIDGRGKSVVAEAIIPGHVVRSVLKSDVDALVELNIAKNLIGSAMAGSIGGFNAHASNLVSAIFLATGQDPAQNVESSNCITVMRNLKGNLQISVSMPSIEVGTIGGGTILEPQAAMLDMLGVRGAHMTSPGENARQLARIVAAGVLAGELSLASALAAGHLVSAHMAHNRSAAPSATPSAAPSRASSPTRKPSPSGPTITGLTENSARR